ncbi:methyltransferase-like protein 17, mitochondrial [Spea bombifrons]|uniref:methyltransferase-like protein 17, mitochondrial n=1 Tax=Spea bombifrons TaxID=233779 RepID=UPI00234BD3B4|nr:methyltransferase-like protein 17, mitochondrial [Spea bombifrons]
MLLARLRLQQIRALSSQAPGLTQLDNSSGLLSQVLHRRHPGIIRVKLVRLPQEVHNAVQVLMKECSIRQVEERVSALNNYLWSRKRPAEEKDLRGQAAKLERKYRESISSSADENDSQQLEKMKSNVLKTLRKNVYHWQPLSYTDELSLVYLVSRFDGGFAAVTRALQEIRQRVPEFTPQTLLDFGSGVGTVTWAAHAVWGESIGEYLCVDASASMNKLSELVIKGGTETGNMHISGVYFRQFLPLSPKVQYDLVVSAFSLNDLPSMAERQKTIQTLWRKTGNFLVLVENGTREGHQLLMEARETVLKKQDKEIWDHRPPHVFAPCPHDLPCPKLAQKIQVPCNFTQSYQPLNLSWNSPQRCEKFSFLILSRNFEGKPDAHWPRVISPVLRRPRHVHCHMCCADGKIHHDVITARRHGRDLYRCARNSEWGDRLPALTPFMNSDTEQGEDMD